MTNLACKSGEESVIAVVVLYGKVIEQVESLKTLLYELDHGEGRYLCLKHILIYDNSKEPCNLQTLKPSEKLTYIHNQLNGGTVAAYNYAFDLAVNKNYRWVLLLDQDSILPFDYFNRAASKLKEEQIGKIAALIPYVKHGEHLISPAFLTKYGSVIPFTSITKNDKQNRLTAVASGAFLLTESIKDFTPFPDGFWLDYVDHWIFMRLNIHEWRIEIFKSIIRHNLSVNSISELNATRLESILNGEKLFFSYLSLQARFIYFFRILKRLWKYSFNNRKLIIPMLHWVFKRLFGTTF